ncbi:hypothetical protein GT516_00170 [Collinsella sp. BIOML-A4]|nr:hypothetical protein [Collinsella sp. BIOML-A2]MZJ28342.1 hypothetical protein [Collinsella sp. BIOML-A3]MZJ32140.1 hypothetical protein [Collinsella sp. BIOML-A1]MZJ95852.1 hypothetical protein [Collinsella sp. BIOML-A6]MZK29740.1 hypothetical protein [Collinsella sp. BIOML-A5]MZK65158.1 hypothetical protein [Collinsella sp. BIOML-A4]
MVIHCDLKPSNIIVSGVRYAADAGMTFSSLVIIDLGIAHVWRDGADADTVKFGTRPYAPPEQYGFGQTSVRSDIDALGALLFFCLTRTDPKPGPEYARAMRGPRRSRPACRCYLHGDSARSGQALCKCRSAGARCARGIRAVFARGELDSCDGAFNGTGRSANDDIFRTAAPRCLAGGPLPQEPAFTDPGTHWAYMERHDLCGNLAATGRKPFCRIPAHGSQPQLSNVVFGP